MRLPVCPGPLHRREFLRVGLLTLGGATLSDLLAARAAAGQPTPDTSVILFWMWGGPSQIETWDPKPNAPEGYRGPFRPIATRVPGIAIGELFPRTPQDMLATIYRHLGIDAHHAFLDTAGRPIPILHEGKPIAELL